jgi:hypothetical protein
VCVYIYIYICICIYKNHLLQGRNYICVFMKTLQCWFLQSIVLCSMCSIRHAARLNPCSISSLERCTGKVVLQWTYLYSRHMSEQWSSVRNCSEFSCFKLFVKGLWTATFRTSSCEVIPPVWPITVLLSFVCILIVLQFSVFYHHARGSKFLKTVGAYLPNYILPHPSGPEPLYIFTAVRISSLAWYKL